MTTHTDITRLRALHTASLGDDPEGDAGFAFHNIIHDCAPALFDELESLRGEVERLRTTQAHPGYVAAHNLANKAMDSEREAIVAWLRDCAEYDMADAIERGDHFAGEENP